MSQKEDELLVVDRQERDVETELSELQDPPTDRSLPQTVDVFVVKEKEPLRVEGVVETVSM